MMMTFSALLGTVLAVATAGPPPNAGLVVIDDMPKGHAVTFTSGGKALRAHHRGTQAEILVPNRRRPPRIRACIGLGGDATCTPLAVSPGCFRPAPPGGDRLTVFAVDRSGSMGGQMAPVVAALTAAIPRLRARDRVAVLAYDSRPTVVLSPTEVRGFGATQRAKVAQIRPAGGTRIVEALLELRILVSRSGAAHSHVILLSDGQSGRDGMPFAVDALRRNKATVSTLSLGPNADRETLKEIAEKGQGRYYHAATAADVQPLLFEELGAPGYPTCRVRLKR